MVIFANFQSEGEQNVSKQFELQELEINEISLVDHGANDAADITLIKRDDIAKQLEQSEIEKAALKEQLAMHDLSKQAVALWPHLSGTLDEKAVILKHVSQLPEAVRNSIMQFLNAANTAVQWVLQEQGVTHIGEEIAVDDEEALNQLAKSYASQNNISLPVAKKRLVSENPEATALFKRVLARVQKRD